MATYQQVLRTIHRSGADYVFIGLSAAGAYGATAASYDLDFFVRPDPKHLECVRRAFRKLGMDDSLSKFDSATVVAWEATVKCSDAYGGPMVDLLTRISGPSFDEVWRDSRVRNYSGVRVRVASLKHIVESKRAAGREKDWDDLKRLERDFGDLLRETRGSYRIKKR